MPNSPLPGELFLLMPDTTRPGRGHEAERASLAFNKDVIGGARVFRTPYSGDLVYCDRMFRDAIRAAGFGD